MQISRLVGIATLAAAAFYSRSSFASALDLLGTRAGDTYIDSNGRQYTPDSVGGYYDDDGGYYSSDGMGNHISPDGDLLGPNSPDSFY